jgi:hypothetical protein
MTNSADEIQYRQANIKFVYIKISGNIENYKFSLSRKGR